MEYNLFMGGQAGNTSNRAMPSGSVETILGYADHQRSRDYAVTRQLDFRPSKPWGGIDITVACKDYDWYKSLLESGTDVKAGDIINLIAITPNSRVEYISGQVVVPKTGLTFNLIRRIDASPGTPATSTVILPAAVTAPAPNAYLASTGLGPVAGIYTSQRLVDTGGAPASMRTHSFVAIEIVTVPAAPARALEGLFFIAQAEVVDWGSYDFNGNV
jgi:hypothetical protein